MSLEMQNRLARAMSARNHKPGEAAAAIGISEKTVRNWLNGSFAPRSKALEKAVEEYCRVLDGTTEGTQTAS